MEVPLSPLLPGLFPSANSMIRGTGTLSWLSPKAGLIDCSKPVQATVSFQLKDFCDSGVTDLTTVLRVGFRLSFHAIPNANPNEWIANYVSPITDQNGTLSEGPELNLEAFEPSNMPPGKGGKDTYLLEKEMRALTFLLQIFQKGSVHYIPLSNLHSRISNSGDQELSRYIGSSSLKRRQFIEDRSYIFHLAENDVVYLQAPEVYQTVTQLAQFLLSHGGVTSSDVLFNYFQNSQSIPMAIKESIHNRRAQFMQFLSRHPFAFAPFPSQYYVGVRRNLPYFDYGTFIRKVFPNFHSARPHSRPILQSNESFESPLVSPMADTIPSLTNANPLGSHGHGTVSMGIANGYGSMNGHGHGHGAAHHGIQHGHTHHGSAGALAMLGAGSGGNATGGLGPAQSVPFMAHPQQNAHGIMSSGGMLGAGSLSTTAGSTHQKPLFSLFDEQLTLSSTNTHQQQNGAAIRSSTTIANTIVGNGSSSSNGSVTPSGTGASSIWSCALPGWDRDIFKMPDLTASSFGLGDSGGAGSASPPVTKKREFVECAVQTEESSFLKHPAQPLCASCAQKI